MTTGSMVGWGEINGRLNSPQMAGAAKAAKLERDNKKLKQEVKSLKEQVAQLRSILDN